MEVRIVITDAGSGRRGAPAVSVEGGSDGAADPGPSAQDRADAINAGPAPLAATFSAPGAPEPFVGQRAANALGPAGGGRSTDESGGAAPGAGSEMETFTEAQNG